MEEKLRLFAIFLASMVLVGSLLTMACSAAPTASPTQIPATPAKAVEPTKAAAEPTKAVAGQPAPAQATAAPTKTVDFPQKGKAITMIVPWVAGGSNDALARMVAAGMEKQLGTPVQVLNKPGASSQIGLTELAQAKPDGYTLALDCVPTTQTVLLDPSRKASISPKDLQPVAVVAVDPVVVSVSAEGPYKTGKDLIEAAKAAPEKIKVGSVGVMSSAHMAVLQMQKASRAKFTIVQFEGDPKALVSVMAGDVDGHFGSAAAALPLAKGEKIRVVGLMGEKEVGVLPGVPTFRSLGYDAVYEVARGFVVPAKTSKEVVAVLEQAIASTFKSPEFQKKAEELAMPLRYMNSAEYEALMVNAEKMVGPLMAEIASESSSK